MFKRLMLFFAAAILLFPAALLADTGESGGAVLAMPVGAAPAGMGEAYVSREGDIYSLHYNTTGISSIKDPQMSLLYQRGIAGDNFGALLFGMPFDFGSLAAGVVYYNAGNITLIDLSAQERTVNAQQDFYFNIGYAREIIDNLSLGINAKFLHSTLVEEFSASAFGFDAGAVYRISLDEIPVNIGASVQNIGTPVQYIDEGDNLPILVRAGASASLKEMDVPLIVAADGIMLPADNSIKCNLGAEYSVGEMLALRAGYKLGYDAESITAGFGVMFDMFRLDYSFGFVSGLESTHKVSVFAELGGRPEVKSPKITAEKKSFIDDSQVKNLYAKYEAGIRDIDADVGPQEIVSIKELEDTLILKIEKIYPVVILKDEPVENYNKGKAGIPEKYIPLLDELANKIKNSKDCKKVVIAGHACSLGSSEFNKWLSIERSKNIKEYLVEKHGIGPDMLYVFGKGENEPVYSNDTEENRRKNRRIEVFLRSDR